ncbi:MAG: hypothetical protein K2M31_07855 [Muribaculaceae bacterium]|nr:hypothetical protein [Muribaculaceae bacterium]
MQKDISSEKVDIVIPQSWQELSDKQLKRIFKLLSMDFDSDEVAVLIFLFLSDLEIIGSYDKKHYILRHKKLFFESSVEEVAEWSKCVDFLLIPPDSPVRIEKWRRRKALSADLQDEQFSTYIIIDNLYQGYLFTEDSQYLDQIIEILYPGAKAPFPDHMRLNCVFWLAALKSSLSRRFPDFFTDITASDNPLSSGKISPQAIQEAMNAQIRALTKGDITKENQVLEMDLYRALTELNAQAKEYKELKAKMKS